MCPIWFLKVGVKLLPFIMPNVETESTKINILSSQLLIFPGVSTDYMLVCYNKQHLSHTRTQSHMPIHACNFPSFLYKVIKNISKTKPNLMWILDLQQAIEIYWVYNTVDKEAPKADNLDKLKKALPALETDKYLCSIEVTWNSYFRFVIVC